MHDQDLSRQMIGQYELRELLGEGGMGSVYRAYQVNLKREVAIKVLPAKLASSPGYLERFSREAATAASLEHAHIIPVYDYGSYQNITYIVMRLLTGGTLSQRVAQHQADGHKFLSLGEIAVILHQLASALDYAHSRGVIHRDIKPGNVMFDNHGSAYLVDFGIARLMEVTTHLTATGVMVGTPLYMPPEQWQSEAVTSAADQYSLAVMIYQLATGHTPFETDTPYALMNKHINEPPTPPQAFRAGIPESVSLVLQRALAKKPGERFPTITAFAQAFGDAIEGVNDESTQFLRFKFAPSRAGGALPFSTPQIPRRPEAAPFYRSPVLWAAGLVLALFVALGVFLVSQQSNAASSDDSALVTASLDELAALRETNAVLLAQVATASATPSSSPAVSPTATLAPTDTATETFTLTASHTLTVTATVTNTPESPTPTSTRNRTLTALARTLTRIAVFNNQATVNAQRTAAQAAALTMPTVTLAAAPAVVTVTGASGANLRGGPGQAYPVVESAPRGRSYDVLARAGSGQNLWYLVRATERDAWIWSGVVTLTPADAVVGTAATIPPLRGSPPTSTSRPVNPPATSAGNPQAPTNPAAPGGGQPPATQVVVPTATFVPPTSVPPTSVPPTAVPPTAVPPTAVPPTSVPPTAVPPTAVPPTAIPPTNPPPPTFEDPGCPPPPAVCP